MVTLVVALAATAAKLLDVTVGSMGEFSLQVGLLGVLLTLLAVVELQML